MNKRAFGNRISANDECYTTKETAEYIVNKYGYLMEDKRIILPCDCEWSELYKACKDKGYNCEIAQDMWGTDYSKYDLLFTNPPFHGVNKWITWLVNNEIKFLLIAPWTISFYCCGIKGHIKNKLFYIENSPNDLGAFIKPDGSYYYVHWGLVTNLEEGKAIVEAKPQIRFTPTDEWQNYNGICRDIIMCNYLDYDYKQIEKIVIRKPQEELYLWDIL